MQDVASITVFLTFFYCNFFLLPHDLAFDKLIVVVSLFNIMQGIIAIELHISFYIQMFLCIPTLLFNVKVLV